MSFLARIFDHSPTSAGIAKERLQLVLAQERVRIGDYRKPVSISFKGSREGLRITLGEGEWHDLVNDLARQLDRPAAQSFFRGCRVQVDSGHRALRATELEQLIGLLQEHQMTLSSVLGQAIAPDTFGPPATLPVLPPPEVFQGEPPGIAPPEPLRPERPTSPGPEPIRPEHILTPRPEPIRPEIVGVPTPTRVPGRPGHVIHYAGTAVVFGDANPPLESVPQPLWQNIDAFAGENPLQASQALLIRRTLHSGQVIHYAGTVVVFGDVNPAAEVIADGDIIVLGKLSGVVHAGAAGDENAVVGALILAPTQVRIGNQIARAPDEKRWHPWPAEIARVRGGQIVVEPWGVP